MGFRPPPPAPAYGVDCLACWPEGHTPADCIIFFSDIELCPGEPTQPYGSFPTVMDLHGIDPCNWWGQKGGIWTCLYTSATAGGNSILSLAAWEELVAFISTKTACQTGFVNETDCEVEGTIGHGGAAQVIFRTGGLANINDICKLVNIPNDIDTKFDCTPIDAQYSVFHFYRKGMFKDIRIKVDMTAL